MKMRLVFIILLILNVSTSFSQTAKIKGLSFMQIGMIKSQVIDTLNKLIPIKLQVSDADFFVKIKKSLHKKTETYLLTENKHYKSEYGIEMHEIMDTFVSTIYIDVLNIANIDIHNISLRFYKDTLYEISTDAEYELRAAFNKKYGECVTNKKTKKVMCSNKKDGLMELEEETYFSDWENNKSSISVFSMSGIYYSSECEKRYISTFVITDDTFKNKIVDNISVKPKEVDLNKL